MRPSSDAWMLGQLRYGGAAWRDVGVTAARQPSSDCPAAVFLRSRANKRGGLHHYLAAALHYHVVQPPHVVVTIMLPVQDEGARDGAPPAEPSLLPSPLACACVWRDR